MDDVDSHNAQLSDERRAELERIAYRRPVTEQDEREGEEARKTLLGFEPVRSPTRVSRVGGLAVPVPAPSVAGSEEPETPPLASQAASPRAPQPEGEPASQPTDLRWLPEPDDRRRLRRSLVPAAILVVIAVGLGGYFAGRNASGTASATGSLASSTLGSRPLDVSKLTIQKSYKSWFASKQRAIDTLPSSMQLGANLFEDKTTRLILAEPDGAAYWVAEEPGADPGYCIVAIPPRKSTGGISSETDCEPTADFLKGGVTLVNDGVMVTWTATEFEIG